MPRLGRFLPRHPELDVRVSASERLVDFGLEPVDLGIRYGSGKYPGLVVTKLADDAPQTGRGVPELGAGRIAIAPDVGALTS